MSNAKRAIALFITPWALGACATQEEPIAVRTPPASARPAESQPLAEVTPSAKQPASTQRQKISASHAATAIESLPQPDRDFLKQAAGANLAAIRFGELAANNGASVEVRSLGREMVDTHTALSDQLRTSANTEGITLPMAQMTARQQQMYDELSALSGRAFDEAFERNVMTLQREAIASFQNEAVHGKLSELAMLANQTLPLINQRARTVQNQLQRM
jgi:predicted outer membrane protein